MLATCGKGGSMDAWAFGDACVRVARRLWVERAEAPAAELLAEMLDRYYPDTREADTGGSGSSDASAGPPASTRMEGFARSIAS